MDTVGSTPPAPDQQASSSATSTLETENACRALGSNRHSGDFLGSIKPRTTAAASNIRTLDRLHFPRARVSRPHLG
jgi:hypothetical protein